MDIDVRTQQGVVRGRMDEGVATFKGISYAAPPFGANRYRPPQPAAHWDGVREAFKYGLQSQSPLISHPLMRFFPSQQYLVRIV